MAEAFLGVGVRDTAMTGTREKLQSAVRTVIQQAIGRAGTELRHIDLILASGMITSDVGLCQVPHLPTPAGVPELARGLVQSRMPEVVGKPIWFAPGVKNNVFEIGPHNYEAMDIMRGEEVEVFGILARLNIQGPAILILPGSHSKFITVDEHCRITGCVTTIAGELLDVITNKTIISSSVHNSFAGEINREMLLRGAGCARDVGLGRACFSIRILEQFTGTSAGERENFLLGAVLGTDLLALKNTSALHVDPTVPVVISGKKILRQAFEILVREDDFLRGNLITANDATAKDVAGFGLIVVARERGLFNASLEESRGDVPA